MQNKQNKGQTTVFAKLAFIDSQDNAMPHHPRPVAFVAHPGAVAGPACAVLCGPEATEPGGPVVMFIEPPWYVIRMPVGVGGEAP